MSAHVTFSSNQYFSDQNDEKSDTLPPEAAIFTQLRKGESDNVRHATWLRERVGVV